MSNRDGKKTDKVTLDIEFKDLVDMVSRSKAPLISGTYSKHMIEGEELKKAWFQHVLISMEKLGDTIQEVRTKDLVELRKELKAEFQKEIQRVEAKVIKDEDTFEIYKKETIKPIHDKLTVLVTRLATWSVLAGFIGSGLMCLLMYLAKEYFFKGGP